MAQSVRLKKILSQKLAEDKSFDTNVVEIFPRPIGTELVRLKFRFVSVLGLIFVSGIC